MYSFDGWNEKMVTDWLLDEKMLAENLNIVMNGVAWTKILLV